ncbi:MAG: OmpA family protein, partial [Bacteroidota bacterium]
VSTIESDTGMADWGIAMMIDGKLARSLSGAVIEQNRLSDQFTVAELERLSSGSGVSYNMTVTDKAGTQITTGTQDIGTHIDRVRQEDPLATDSSTTFGGAIVFAFNSSQLRADARAALARLRSRIPAGSRISIAGYADETGDAEYNRKLSLARARAVAGELPGFQTQVVGEGEEKELFPPNTPEGRFYSRSVRITVTRDPARKADTSPAK